MKTYKFLAFDFGASSGRAMLAKFDGEKITLEEKHRFSNDPVLVNGGFFWDVLRLFHEIKQGILKCANSGDGDLDGIGIDTWGVDYGLLDKNDKLLGNPYHYRDTRTDGMYDKAFEIVPKEEIFNKTGIAFNWFNTLFQLLSAKLSDDSALNNAKTLLFMPDLFNFFLTGIKKNEYTIASTSQMFDSKNHKWATDLLDKMGIPSDIFPETIYPGNLVGKIKPELAEELGVGEIPVYAVASHDTGSAVASVPVVDQDDFIYISSGTWSLMGKEIPEPLTGELAYKYDLTNEGGTERKIRFLKNIMGLWIEQESRRQWKRQGEVVSFDELSNMAMASKPHACFINPDYLEFQTPGNMPKRIAEFCKMTGQYVPETKGEIVRCIFDSLAMCYRSTVEKIDEITGKKAPFINIVGGGTKEVPLCKLTADACGRPVYTGPVEATALGNIAVQAIANGEIKDTKEAREVIANSFEISCFEPHDTDMWDEGYEKFKKIVDMTK